MRTERLLFAIFLAAGLRLAAGPTDARAFDVLVDPPLTVREGNEVGAGIGYAISTAGDVNGDGYSDVLVTGPDNHGTVYCYYGGTRLLFLSPSWTVSGGAGASSFGSALAAAGDINGDGYDDVLISDYTSTGGQGAVYIYTGSSSGLSDSPQRILTGPVSPSNFGQGIAPAGDVNGDGYDDILVGAPQISNGQTNEGSVYLYLGSSLGIASSPAWTFESNVANAFLGTRVSAAGDVNGDGYDDYIVSAPNLTNGQNDEGKVYLFLGSLTGPASAPSWTYEGNVAGAEAGKGLCGAGDVNGDGYSDIVLNIFNNTSACQVLVFLGGPNGPGTTPDRTSSTHNFGQLFTAGDLNGDGCADIVAGDITNNNYTGQAYVLAGNRTWNTLPVAAHVGGTRANDNFGATACAAGDVNGDGFGDLLVGEPGYDNGQADEGRVILYFGQASMPANGQFFSRNGQALSNYGTALAHGDFNGDGFSDLAVGDPTFDDAQTDEGEVEVFYGRATGYPASPDWTVKGTQAGGRFGMSVTNAGDVDNDGCDDLVIGEPGFGDADHPLEGAAHLYRGGRSGLSGTPAWNTVSGVSNAFFGYAVSGAGDVNGDGYADVLVGAPDYAQGSNIGGQASLYLGSATTLSTTASWTAFGGASGGQFGYSVAGAGDVNGDGYSDIAIGDPLATGQLYQEGKAYVYNGSPAGPVSPAAWSARGGQVSAHFGSAVAAGDIVADGFSDVVVGAPDWDDSGHVDAGFVSIFLGQPGGLMTAPTMFWPGTAGGDQLGAALSVGDVSNDGCSDLLVGAPGNDTVVNNGGEVYLYLGQPNSFVGPTWLWYGTTASGRLGSALNIGGDVNGDGFGDVILGVPFAGNTGQILGFYGGCNTLDEFRAGVQRRPQQFRADGTTSVALLGATDQSTSLVMGANARSGMGRDHVQAEYQLAPAGVAFSGPVLPGGTFDTGAPVAGLGRTVYATAAASGLTPMNAYHWRLRFKGRSPYFPHTVWCSMPGNGGEETDARTGADPAEVPGGARIGSALRFSRVDPNPCFDGMTLQYNLRDAGPARLTLYNIAGRRVRTLVDGYAGAGMQSAHWDTRDASGTRVPAGVYLARLEQGTRTATAKLVVRR